MTEPLRNRLLLSLGLGALTTSGCSGGCGPCHDPTYTTTVNVGDLLKAMEDLPDYGETGTSDTDASDTDVSDTDASDTDVSDTDASDTDPRDTGARDTDPTEDSDAGPPATCPEGSWEVGSALGV